MASVVGCLVLLVLTTAVEPRYAKVMHENYILRPSSFLRGDSLLLAESPKRERRIGLDSTKLLLSNLNLRGGGLLITGEPLDWEESLQYLPYVREHGVLQFIHTFNANKNRSGEKLLWGEELEYGIMKLNSQNKTVKLSLRGAEVLSELLSKEEKHGRSDNRKEACSWHPEYGAWMVEGTPRMPFGGYVRDLRRVEQSMRLRRRRLLSALRPGEIAPTVTTFPLMGLPDTTDPPTAPGDTARSVSASAYCSDRLINPHPRFAALTANIRKRRGERVNIRVPLFIDSRTLPDGPADPADLEPVKVSGLDWHVPRREVIHMDCMAFGMGMCCLQVTFQARDVAESRHLYDQVRPRPPAARPSARRVRFGPRPLRRPSLPQPSSCLVSPVPSGTLPLVSSVNAP